MRNIECLGGPLCGSKVADTKELWLGIRNVNDESDEHYYKRVKIVNPLTGKSVLLWHYHGREPAGRGVPLLRPSDKLFR